NVRRRRGLSDRRNAPHWVRRELFLTTITADAAQLRRTPCRSIRQLWNLAMKHTLRTLACLGAIGLAATLNAQTRPQVEYSVGAQDVLTIQVFGEPDLSGKF